MVARFGCEWDGQRLTGQQGSHCGQAGVGGLARDGPGS